MTGTRWDRLAADLVAAGIDARLDSRRYSELRYGRVHHGTSYCIILRGPDDGTVEVHDKWWSKNPAVWIGWQVHHEGADSIVTRAWPLTKKRGEILDHVRDALDGDGR